MSEHRVLIRSAGRLAFYPEDASAPACCTSTTAEGLCPHCLAAYRRLESAGLVKAAPATRAAAKPKSATVTAFRGVRRSGGRTVAEKAEDAALVADLKALRGGKPRAAEEPAPATRTARRQRPVYAPRGYSAAVGRNISRPAGLAVGDPPPVVTPEERAEATEEDREAARAKAIVRRGLPWITDETLDGMDLPTLQQWAEAIEAREAEFEAAVADAAAPKGITAAMKAKQTAEQKAAAEIDAVSRETELPDGKPWGYSRALAKEQTLADLRAGRQERLKRPRRHDPTTPPKGYTRALEARKAVAA